MYNFWVKELDCVSCGHQVSLFRDYRVAAGRYENDDKYNVFCPECQSVTLVDDWQSDSQCNHCNNEFVPKEGTVSRGGYYNCPECGQKESIVEAVQGQDGYNRRLYAVEYYCEECDQQGSAKSSYKGYKKAEVEDKQLFAKAQRDWNTRTDLHDYIPHEQIPPGHLVSERNPVFEHGYSKWSDFFNSRQLLSLSLLLESISKIDDQNVKEYLLLAFSETLNYVNEMVIYQHSTNKGINIFKSNSFDPPTRPVENNPWGTEFGAGNFQAMWDMVKRGVEYAKSPTERYVRDGDTVETDHFAQPIGLNSEVYQDDMRNITAKNEYDAVITDPPYYDNIIYSEVADYFYVWQKIILEEVYPGFDQKKTPRAESIVTNPYLGKTADDFEHEMGQALGVIKRALKDEGTLVFTYHHSDEESWGELLESLCENGFEVTATYPINSDLHKFIGGESVAFDIVIVARPTEDREPISWNSLRRRIVRTATKTREMLEEHRDLASGDIGVIEMGKCFQEYSKFHGEVRRAGDVMSAKDVVDEIYGIIQNNDRGEQDIYLDLLEERNPTYNDLNKHLKRSDASEEQMREMVLFQMSGNDFELCGWRNEKRQAYVQDKVEEGNGELTELDKAHFLRYRFEEGKSTSEYLEQWDADALQELCEGLTEATTDDTFLSMIGADISLSEFNKK
jgi:adenine-specific DNA methylase